MYNMSMLRYRFSNERCGGGGGLPEPPSSLILQKCVALLTEQLIYRFIADKIKVK